MTDETKNQYQDHAKTEQSSAQPDAEHRSDDAAKDAAGKARDLANQGINAARQKFEEVGGVEGLKSKGKGFAAAVKAGFVPDEGTAGLKGITSRVKNLWKSGKAGKITVTAAVLVLIMILGNLGGESGSTGVSKKRGVAIKGFYIGMSVKDAANLINKEYLEVFGPLEIKGFADPSKMEEAGQALIKEFKPKATSVEGAPDQAWWDFGKAIVLENSIAFGRQGDGNALFALYNLSQGSLSINDGFEADDDSTIVKISFSPSTVNSLFNVKDMSGDDFAQAFVNNYDIPLLDANQREVAVNLWGNVQGGEVYWSYTHSSGMRIIIWENKSIVLERVAAAAERKFD